jgi:hypothetical protein
MHGAFVIEMAETGCLMISGVLIVCLSVCAFHELIMDKKMSVVHLSSSFDMMPFQLNLYTL